MTADILKIVDVLHGWCGASGALLAFQYARAILRSDSLGYLAMIPSGFGAPRAYWNTGERLSINPLSGKAAVINARLHVRLPQRLVCQCCPPFPYRKNFA